MRKVTSKPAAPASPAVPSATGAAATPRLRLQSDRLRLSGAPPAAPAELPGPDQVVAEYNAAHDDLVRRFQFSMMPEDQFHLLERQLATKALNLIIANSNYSFAQRDDAIKDIFLGLWLQTFPDPPKTPPPNPCADPYVRPPKPPLKAMMTLKEMNWFEQNLAVQDVLQRHRDLPYAQRRSRLYDFYDTLRMPDELFNQAGNALAMQEVQRIFSEPVSNQDKQNQLQKFFFDHCQTYPKSTITEDEYERLFAYLDQLAAGSPAT